MTTQRSTNLTKSKRATIFGWLLIGTFFYVLLSISLYAYGVIALTNNQVVDIWPVNKYQKYFYHKAIRHIWQYDPLCAELNSDLIYQPKLGACVFNNPEFKTSLNFDSLGRLVPNRQNTYGKNGIAVLGDSHAMGWGVNDKDTFANALQQYTQKPVYNLAVSSYGTHREIKRLIQTGIISKVDTILIQYCENDIGENDKVNDLEAFENERAKFNDAFLNKKETNAWIKAKLILISLRASVSEPFKSAKQLFFKKDSDFSSHLDNLKKVLRHYEGDLKGKKVVIFYVNGYDQNYISFPSGQDQEFSNVQYYDFQKSLPRDNFFVVDGHLNSEGHKNLGLALSNFLNLNKNK